MTGLREIFGRGFWICDRQDRRRPIVRADSGSYSARCVHRNSKVRAMHFAILRYHPLQTELLRALVRNGRANQAAPMRGHEVDRFRRHFLGRHHQVAFILAVGVVGHDHNATLCDIAHHIIDRVELKCLFRLRNHRNNTITAPAARSNYYSCCCW